MQDQPTRDGEESVESMEDEQTDNENSQPKGPVQESYEELGSPPLGDNDSWVGPDTPAEYLCSGPWFVLVPATLANRHRDAKGKDTQWDAERFDNALDADAKAIELVRSGHPMVYIGRGLFEVTVPVQMTQLIERKPTPEVQG